MVKPFGVRELDARLRIALCHAPVSRPLCHAFSVGYRFTVDPSPDPKQGSTATS
ncbi:MAG TPA: hypothetical protein VGS97_08415 [Actinocrinis sp.]|uniref:hypothetical protein n=1 Tax=Actinocrinis sp. TaxID=1920516 RepID=UPI002DDD3D79|nr:hypothetical protein [Actinocrinis sp.]HEV2344101.1 hypothetical protein [Actinocrinis sp.]